MFPMHFPGANAQRIPSKKPWWAVNPNTHSLFPFCSLHLALGKFFPELTNEHLGKTKMAMKRILIFLRPNFSLVKLPLMMTGGAGLV